MSVKAFYHGDKMYVEETATAEEKAELKAANPELYARHFKDVEEISETIQEEVIPEEVAIVKRTRKK